MSEKTHDVLVKCRSALKPQNWWLILGKWGTTDRAIWFDPRGKKQKKEVKETKHTIPHILAYQLLIQPANTPLNHVRCELPAPINFPLTTRWCCRSTLSSYTKAPFPQITGDLATEQANLAGCLSSEKAFSFQSLNNQFDAVDYTTNKYEVLLNSYASIHSPLKVIARMHISWNVASLEDTSSLLVEKGKHQTSLASY